MTKALEAVFDAASKLPPEKQDTLAAVLRRELAGDARWEALFNAPKSEQLLDQLAAEAREHDREGRTTPLDPNEL